MALDTWVFTAGSGQYLTEDVPGPISDTQIVSNNQPYVLWNFLSPFTQIQAVSACAEFSCGVPARPGRGEGACMGTWHHSVTRLGIAATTRTPVL